MVGRNLDALYKGHPLSHFNLRKVPKNALLSLSVKKSNIFQLFITIGVKGYNKLEFAKKKVRWIWTNEILAIKDVHFWKLIMVWNKNTKRYETVHH